MTFQEPKVEFIKMQLTDMVIETSGNSSTISQCDGETYSTEDCTGSSTLYNY